MHTELTDDLTPCHMTACKSYDTDRKQTIDYSIWIFQCTYQYDFIAGEENGMPFLKCLSHDVFHVTVITKVSPALLAI